METSIKDYLDSLKSSSPTPGGGSANCLVAKTAISLALMSINVSKNRKSYQNLPSEAKESVEEAIKRLEETLIKLDSLAIEDEKVFNDFMAVYKAKDNERLEEVSINCYNVPFSTYMLCQQSVDIVMKLKPYVVSSIISDYKMSLTILKSVLECSMYNLDINMQNIKNIDCIRTNDLAHRSCKIYIKKIDKFLRGIK